MLPVSLNGEDKAHVLVLNQLVRDLDLIELGSYFAVQMLDTSLFADD